MPFHTLWLWVSHMDNYRASIFMVVSMALFAIEDMFVKRISDSLPVGQILISIGIGGFVFLSILAASKRQNVFSPKAFVGAVFMRNLGELIGTAGYVTALALNPIATVGIILQATPILVTIGAVIFLKEQVGWRRWVAIAVGLTGVLIILRPGTAEFRVETLWAVLGVVGLSVRDIATRRIRTNVTTAQLTAWGFGAVIISGLCTLHLGPPPSMPTPQIWVELLGALIFGMIGYALLTISTREGDLSVVAPFRYSRAVFALIIGVLVFSEKIDQTMMIGAALIIGSGLYSLAREAHLRRLARAGSST